LTPPSQADLLRAALDEAWPPDRLGAELDAYERRHAADPP
jgi:hypothetical protein